MPRYRKAYLLSQLRAFCRWDESRLQDCELLQAEAKGPRSEDDVLLFIMEDLRVTSSAFEDEPIVFSTDSVDWECFCREELGFKTPNWQAESVSVRKHLERSKESG